MKRLFFCELLVGFAYVAFAVPTVTVVSTKIRNTDPSVMDVVYRVNSDKATVRTRALAFEDGVRSFAKVIRPQTFVDGTGANLGDAIAANVDHTVSWRVTADCPAASVSFKFEVLATDGELLPLELKTVPATTVHAGIEFSHNELTETQVFNALCFLYADKDAGLEVSNAGELKNGDRTLVNGGAIATPSAAVGFVLGKMGYTLLAGDELVYANNVAGLSLAPNGIKQYGVKEIGAVLPEDDSADLVFHCSFDSTNVVAKPEVGACTGTLGSGQIVSGKFGNAYYLPRKTPGAQFNVPKGLIEEKGCVEFWGKLNEAASGMAFSNGSPMFFYINCHDAFETAFQFSWNKNNGAGGAGLYTSMPGDVLLISDNYGAGVSYSKYLGEDISDWHHYAVVWNADGISSLATAAGAKVLMAIFVDGKAVTYLPLAGHENWKPSQMYGQNTDIDIGCRVGAYTANERSFTMDELKIWKTDKTSFGL
ncbi:MAG: hypothetical protein MJ240_03445 [Kiritimatiellae bacterium]|nr:hypothetical protein [Kiritimatiellia bacterium]